LFLENHTKLIRTALYEDAFHANFLNFLGTSGGLSGIDILKNLINPLPLDCT
jgi:hypothetical protein